MKDSAGRGSAPEVAAVELRGAVLPAEAPASTGGRDELLARLTAAWLRRSASEHTRKAYRRDLGDWLAFLQRRGTHPLDARMSDMDDWITFQREHGMPQNGTERKGAKVSDAVVRGLYDRWKAKEASVNALAREAGVSRVTLTARFAKLERDRQAGLVAGGASKASIARRTYAVAAWYDYLICNTASDPEPLIRYNPARTKAVPKVSKDASPTIGLSRAESDRLIAAADADGPRSAAVIRFLLTNGDRVGVIESLKVTDLGHDKGHRVINRTIKGGVEARDPIPPPTAAAIDAYLASRDGPAEGLLFVTPAGKPLSESYVYRLVQRLARRAGIPSAGKLSPHSLRATAISELLEATSGNLGLAQDFAHHADPRTTQGYNKRRHQLDGHAAYILAGRYGVRHDDAATG